MELKRTLTKRMQKLSSMRRKDADAASTSRSSSVSSSKPQKALNPPSSIELPPKSVTPTAQSAPATPITPSNEEEFLSIPFEQAAPSPRSPRPALVSTRSSRSASVASHTQHDADVGTRLVPHRSPARSRSSSGAMPPATVSHSDSLPLLPSLSMPGTALPRRSSAGAAPLSPTSLYDDDFDEMESAADEMAQSILDRVQNDTETQRWSL